MVKRLAVLALVAACQGTGKPTDAPADAGGSGVAGFGSARHVTPPTGSDAIGSGSDTAGDPYSALGSADMPPAPGSAGSGSGSDVPDVPEPITDPGKALFEMGAVPAWQTVIDRTLYLDRRKQHGVAYGVLGGDVMVPGVGSGSGSASLIASPYVWLVDDTEGNGALAIRVKLPDNARLHPVTGDRVALGGGWSLDDAHRWFWKVDAITALPALPPPKFPWGPPSHAIGNGELPQGARTISLAKENDFAYFMLVGPPPTGDGDGWAVADELGNPVYAILAMPGERPTYGAQDMRTADERWALRRGQTYVVRIGKIHKHGDKPATITARSGPVRVK
jgi:hypothetical protein